MEIQKYGTFDADGLPIQFYSVPDAHTQEEVPADAVALTTEQWNEFISHPVGARLWINGQIEEREVPLFYKPDDISDRQFFHGLALWGLIPTEEALEAVKTGFIPTRLKEVIDQVEAAGMLPEGMTRFDVDIVIAGATSYAFDHAIAPVIGQAFGWDEERRREFWEFAAQL